MAVRSVSVRYSASVGAAMRDLDRYAKANDKVARAAERAGAAVDKAATKATAASKRTAAAADRAAAAEEKSANRRAVAGGVIALGLGVAISKFVEFDAAMSQAQAASSTTGDELLSLRDAAIKAGQDTQYSATQAAQGITELSKAGVGAADILSGALDGALNLAAAGQIEVADAAEIAATALNQFKLKGDDVTHVADLLAAGSNKAQGGVGDLGAALKQSGLVASQTGLSIEETTAALTSFASAGLIGSDAGTSLKTMLQRLTPQSDQAAGLMDELGISAYDAAGNFIGLEKFAGNLRESMQDLTPEQRAAANSIIFGSDAVRAANVLYNEGADGIRKWTAEIDQQGYAAKQAATLTDNLKGDVERLSGSFDTVLIQAGSGANDTLRTLVQTGEDLINMLGAIPGPVLTGVTAFAALSLLGPKVGSLAKAVTGPLTAGVAGFRAQAALAQASAVGYGAAVEGAGVKSLTAGQRIGSFGKGLGGLKGAASGVMGLLGGPWGLALTAATVGVTLYGEAQANARRDVDALSATIDEQTGKFTDASRKSVLDKVFGEIDPADLRELQTLGVNLTEGADAALKGSVNFEAYKNKVLELIPASSGARVAAENYVNELYHQAVAADGAIIKQEALNEAKKQALVADSNMAGSASAAERSVIDLGTATDGTADKLDDGKDAADGMAKLIAKLGGKTDDAVESLKALDTALDLLGGGDRALSAAADGQAAAIEAARAAAEKAAEAKAGGKGKGPAEQALDRALLRRTQAQEKLNAVEAKGTKATQTQRISARQALARAEQAVSQAQEKVTASGKTAGEVARERAEAERDLREKLRGVATATIDRLKVQKDENRSVAELTSTYEIGRAEIRRQLELSGLRGKALENETDKIIGTKAEFKLILAEYAKTPAQVASNVKLTGTKTAVENIKMVIKTINGVPTLVPVYIGVTTNAFDAVKGIKGAIDGLGASLFPAPVRKAGGGPVRGPGTSTSDSIPALLSDNEHVLTAEDVHLAGGHDAIYAWRKSLRGFAAGGEVDVLGARPSRRARYGSVAAQAFASGGAVRPLGGSSTWDYARMGAEVAAAVSSRDMPNLHIVSGEDARTAARLAIHAYQYERDPS